MLLTAVFDSGGHVSPQQPPSAMSCKKPVVTAFLFHVSCVCFAGLHTRVCFWGFYSQGNNLCAVDTICDFMQPRPWGSLGRTRLAGRMGWLRQSTDGNYSEALAQSLDGGGVLSSPDWSVPPPGATNLLRDLRHCLHALAALGAAVGDKDAALWPALQRYPSFQCVCPSLCTFFS